MTDAASTPLQPNSAIPADDPNRKLTVADPDSSKVRHVAVVGGTYSILVSGAQTAGRYCLIDMIVPDGSGPPLHRSISRRCSRCLRASLSSPSEVKPLPCVRDRA
jgi:hypothetical protein